MPDVFLSYNREDQQKAKMIAKALEGEGLKVWWDTVLRAGETYDEVTEKRLRDAKSVVVLWSSRSVRSKWVRAEATLGDRKAALIPVMIEACDRPIMFELIQTADLTQWNGDAQDGNWRSLVDDVRAKVERQSVQDAPAPSPVLVSEKVENTQAPPASETIETAYWMSVKDGSDPAEFVSYLRHYPQGHFADLARRRIEALNEAATRAQAAAVATPVKEVAPVPLPVERQPAVVVASAPRTVGSYKWHALVLAMVAVGATIFYVSTNVGKVSTPVEEARVPAAEVPAPPSDPVTVPSAEPTSSNLPTEVAPVTSEVTVTEPPVSPTPEVAKTFRDCDVCPQMTRLSGGAFVMGSPETERGRRAWEGPQRQIRIAPLAMSSKEVSFDEWDACVSDGGCGGYTPTDRGWGRSERPVMMVSWNDAQAYVRWLSAKTGKAYRLPSEAEWEYAARGATSTAYWWGDEFDQSLVSKRQTNTVGALKENAFGLFDVTGNVAEWVDDCYLNDFSQVPEDGRASTAGNCSQRVLRGGSWRDNARELRIASRSRVAKAVRDSTIGFRVVSVP